MGTNVGALVALDAVVRIPNGNERFHTTLLVCRSSILPSSVNGVVFDKVGNLQKVAGLCVHRTDNLLDEIGCVVDVAVVVGQFRPCGVDSQFLIFAATIHGRIVHVDNIFTFLAIRLHDESFHLFYGQLYRDDACNAEESRLENGVGAVAQTDFLANLGSVDVVNLDVVLGKAAFYLVGNEVDQFLTVEDCIQKEGAVLAQTACHVVHVQVSLNVASHEVGRIYQIRRVDGGVAEAEMRASEASGLLGVV